MTSGMTQCYFEPSSSAKRTLSRFDFRQLPPREASTAFLLGVFGLVSASPELSPPDAGVCPLADGTLPLPARWRSAILRRRGSRYTAPVGRKVECALSLIARQRAGAALAKPACPSHRSHIRARRNHRRRMWAVASRIGPEVNCTGPRSAKRQSPYVSSTTRDVRWVPPGRGIRACAVGLPHRAEVRNCSTNSITGAWVPAGFTIAVDKSVGSDACVRFETPSG